jgi:hypothetical protein
MNATWGLAVVPSYQRAGRAWHAASEQPLILSGVAGTAEAYRELLSDLRFVGALF